MEKKANNIKQHIKIGTKEGYISIWCYLASLVTQMVKNLPAMRETWVSSLGWEDALQEGMSTHSSSLAWKIPTDRGAWQDRVHVVAQSRTQPSN